MDLIRRTAHFLSWRQIVGTGVWIGALLILICASVVERIFWGMRRHGDSWKAALAMAWLWAGSRRGCCSPCPDGTASHGGMGMPPGFSLSGRSPALFGFPCWSVATVVATGLLKHAKGAASGAGACDGSGGWRSAPSLMRLRGGITIGAMVKNMEIDCESEDYDRLVAAMQGGESEENWTSDSNAKERLKRELAEPGMVRPEEQLFAALHPGKAAKGSRVDLRQFVQERKEEEEELDSDQQRALVMASAKAKEVDAELDLRVASEGKGNSRQMFNLGAHLAKKGNMTGAVRWFKRAARGGYAKAEYNLGTCLVYGDGTRRNVQAGVKILELAAAKSHPAANLLLGTLYLEGMGVGGMDGIKKDEKRGVLYLTQAAGLKNTEAQYLLARCYQTGSGLRRDEKAAKLWLSRASDGGHAEAAYRLGLGYSNVTGACWEKDVDQRAVEAWERAADRGHGEAQYLCGMLALRAHERFACVQGATPGGKNDEEDEEEEEDGEGGVKPALEVAIGRLQAAAKRGHANASFELARCYSSGSGVDKDMHEAVRLLEVAVKAGVAGAYGALGGIYARGAFGGSEGKAKAVEYLGVASRAGDAKAMLNLGFLCSGGEAPGGGVEALRLFRKAARMGDAVAMCNVAEMFREGKGVERDDIEAIKWLARAAEAGDDHAQVLLARRYAVGDGVLQDKFMGLKWAARAGRRGSLEGCVLAAQLAEAPPVRSEWKAAKWYLEAAKLGSAEAQAKIGEILMTGRGVSEDHVQAAEWLGMAAEKGNMNATVLLGEAYLDGKGVPNDAQHAVELLGIAARMGSRGGFRALGKCHLEGKGMPQNKSKAAELLGKASHMGCIESSLALGRHLIQTGKGREGVELVRKAADGGSLDAIREAYDLLIKGRAVDRDDSAASRYKMLVEQKDAEAVEEERREAMQALQGGALDDDSSSSNGRGGMAGGKKDRKRKRSASIDGDEESEQYWRDLEKREKLACKRSLWGDDDDGPSDATSDVLDALSEISVSE